MSDETLKHISLPDLPLVRASLKGQGDRDEFPERMKACGHPVSGMQQMVDVVNTRDRFERPTNLFQCGVCGQKLWLVDPYGKEARDG